MNSPDPHPHSEYAHSAEELREAFFPLLLARLTPRLWATQTIVAANIIVFIAMLIGGVDPFAPSGQETIAWGANFGPLTTGGEPWRLFTSMFVHFGIIHIGMNMWVLWAVGRFVERCVGTFGFATVYLLSGLAGSIASVWWHPYGASAGASGAIFGMVGVLAGLALRLRAELPLRVLKSLKSSLGMFLIYNVAFGLAVPFIDMSAHLGGLCCGFLCGLMIARPLTPIGAKRRVRAAFSVLALGSIVLSGSFAMVPRVADFQGFFHTFDDTSARVNRVVSQVESDLESQRVSKDSAADLIEEKVLAPWRKLRAELEDFHRLPDNWSTLRDRVSHYAEAQEEVWVLFVRSLREDDPHLKEEAVAKQAEVERLGAALSQD